MYLLKKRVLFPLFIIGLVAFLAFDHYTAPAYVCPSEIQSNAFEKVQSRLMKWGHNDGQIIRDIEGNKGCDLSFVYHSDTELIHFVVIGGYKLTWWNCRTRGECEHLNKLIYPWWDERNLKPRFEKS